MSAIRVPLSEPRYPSTTSSSHAQTQIVLTRQLWERTMPLAKGDGPSTESQSSVRRISEQSIAKSRRASSIASVHSHRQLSPTPSRPSDTPPTPEESPPSSSNRKRSLTALDQQEFEESSPVQQREGSGDLAVNFCICQPEPKVPRPRNAFILYRQTHQSGVVAQNPGLANPEISKIIGALWNSESEEEKNRWKVFAEEEKLQHQQRYPEYRYQPKRAGCRTSVSSDNTPYPYSELRKCQKCGGRLIATPSAPTSAKEKVDKASNSTKTSPSSAQSYLHRANTFQLPPPTPSSTTTPSTRYLPMLNNLSLSSPHARRMAQGRPMQATSPPHRGEDERGHPLTPDVKRRRFENPQGTYVMSTRGMPPRQQSGPGTPFPFPPQMHQQGPPNQHHPDPRMHPQQYYHPAQGPMRRDSLPPPSELLRGRPATAGMPSMMGPPPRPGPGYSQHRLSNGHIRHPGHELSLTLPPLQTANVHPSPATGGYMGSLPNNGGEAHESAAHDNRSLAEKIMSIPFVKKLKILACIAPPLSTEKSTATIIAVEGDNKTAAKRLTDWLEEFLSREGDITVKVVDGPASVDNADSEMHEVLRTIAGWHTRNQEICGLALQSEPPRKDSTATITPGSADAYTSDISSGNVDVCSATDNEAGRSEDRGQTMDTDPVNASRSPKRLVILLRTYTLIASNMHASNVAIRDVYAPSDHWQWMATLWRGIVGPDMTVYVKDMDAKEAMRDNGGKGGLDIIEDAKVMAIRRTVDGDGAEDKTGMDGVEAGTLRRLGFEVGEWVRGMSMSGRSE